MQVPEYLALRPKGTVVDDACGKKRIARIQFGTFSAPEIAKLSEFEVVNDKGYEQPSRTPVVGGVLDRRLGVSDKHSTCETCGARLQDCPGHYGHIQLVLPVFHLGYFKPLIATLQCICKTCSRVLIAPEDRRKTMRQMNHPLVAHDHERRAAVVKRVVEKCKKVRECPHCGALNGLVKKVGSMHIVHEKYKEKDKTERAEVARREFLSSFEHVTQAARGAFESAQTSGADLKPLLNKAQDDLTPLRVKTLLQNIPECDLALLDMSACYGRPENLIIENLLVPPVPIRPSVVTDAASGSNEDDLTVKLAEIITVNNIIRNALAGGKALVPYVMEDWEYLQLQCAMYLSGANVPNVRPEWHAEKRSIRAFAQRLRGKTGRFRGNLSGKRVDFSGRTVISPDPNLAIDEVCVPIHVAKVLTYPQRVFAHNLSNLRQLVLNGPDVWPGANYVEAADTGKKSLKYGDRRRVASELKVGDTVERHLSDGDVVLFNRQPSLHKLSIMAHRAKVMAGRTFRFNECVCAPYNADFDGDEMNLHLPQTEEARAESLALLGVLSNLVTPRNGEIVVSATQDFLTGAYLLSRKSIFLTRCQFARLAVYMGDANERIELPPPAIIKPIEMWTGKQLFTLLLRPTTKSSLLVNLECPNRKYNTARLQPEPLHMCPDDGYVCFQDSELISGVMDKAILGGGSKSSLFAALLRDHSPEASALAMGRLAKLTARFLTDHGFSIGIQDVMPTARLTAEKGRLLERGYEQCDRKISQFDAGKLPPSPGCTPQQTLESEINGLLSKIRDDAGEICKHELHFLNAPLTMATCGSKGSFINISQMIACVGQQSVGGRRMPNGFVHRALPHFPRHSLEPAAKGFVANSFYTGLSPTEFFFHTMGGREGLVDTAVKTAETGYIQRRLMKALEDLTVMYDGSVRNSESNLVQFQYGDDGLDPAAMEGRDGRPLAFVRELLTSRRTGRAKPSVPDPDGAYKPLTPDQMREMVDLHCHSDQFKKLIRRTLRKEPSRYEKDLRKFVENLAQAQARMQGVDPTPKYKPIDEQIGIQEAEAAKAAAEQEAESASTINPPIVGKYGSGKTPGGRIRGSAAGPRGGKKKRIVEDDEDEEKEDEETARQTQSYTAAKTEAEATTTADPTPAFEPPDGFVADGANLQQLSRTQMEHFFAACLKKYRTKRIEPGSAVGAVGAQSIGEPGTQMTLKTFHFAGVASMNVTLGVPRLTEIINASKTISTPIITAYVGNSPLPGSSESEQPSLSGTSTRTTRRRARASSRRRSRRRRSARSRGT